MALHRSSSLGGRRANVALALVALVVAAALVVLGVELNGSQNRARQTLVARFHDRAQVISALIQAEISSVANSTAATRAYAGPSVDNRVLDQAAAQGHLAFLAVLGPGRTLLAESAALTPAAGAQLLASPAVKMVVSGGHEGLSDVQSGGAPGAPGVVDLAVPVQTPGGLRVIVGGLPTPLLSAFLGTYLERVPTPGGVAYVVDSRNVVIGASRPTLASDRPVGAPTLRQALRTETGGSYGTRGYFVSATIPGSPWRVVLTTSQSELFASVDGSRDWLPWVIYSALALAAIAFLVVLRRQLTGAAALREANRRLETSNARLESSNALLRRAAELSRSNAELEQFASIASHDLQEPLRKVQTFAAQLVANEQENLSPQGQDFLRRMNDAAGRMRSLINDLLMFSRVSTQARPFTAVNLGDVIAQVLIDLEVSIEDAGAQVLVGTLPTIDADPLQMRQLLQNLIGNGLKFRREGVTPELRVSANVVDHIAELTVQDNGIGFDDQYATRIFRAFERLHGPQAYPGTGIGLALCRKIVERHHGTITAEGKVGRGATFIVRLPVQQPEEHEPPGGSVFPETIEDEVLRVLA
jgi:signal transduction histidine kinase